MRMRIKIILLGVIAVATSVVFVACDDGSTAIKEPPPGPGVDSGPSPGVDSGPGGDGGDGGSSDCVLNPKTHLEIINACTNATRLTKNPTLPKLLPDGGLPPLL
jgi:hypothetical protein